MAALHLLTFPGALIPSIPIIGGAKTVSWLYVLWGLAVGLLVAAVIASDALSACATVAGQNCMWRSAQRCRRRFAAVLLLADPVLPPFAVGDQFSPWAWRSTTCAEFWRSQDW